jgi:hypothetical protein
VPPEGIAPPSLRLKGGPLLIELRRRFVALCSSLSEWLESHQRQRGSRPRALLLSYTRSVSLLGLAGGNRTHDLMDPNHAPCYSATARKLRLGDWICTSGLTNPIRARLLLRHTQISHVPPEGIEPSSSRLEVVLLDPRVDGIGTTGRNRTSTATFVASHPVLETVARRIFERSSEQATNSFTRRLYRWATSTLASTRRDSNPHSPRPFGICV